MYKTNILFDIMVEQLHIRLKPTKNIVINRGHMNLLNKWGLLLINSTLFSSAIGSWFEFHRGQFFLESGMNLISTVKPGLCDHCLERPPGS